MLSTPKAKGELFLASSLCDGLEDSNLKQVITLLESKDADPNVLLPMHGITPFHLVIGNESEKFAEEVTKLFLRHGGNPNVKSVDGMTPIHVAAAWGRVRVLELLLANGGDPLCLDDDGRSPFHYAFDGSFYDAITVLGKYCTKNQEDAEDEDEEEGRIRIKLEKILINRGDVIAEYVPSETDLTNDTQSKIDETTETGHKLKRLSASESESDTVTASEYSERNSSSSEEPTNLNTDNITFRRHQSGFGKNSNSILPPEDLNFDFKGRSVAEEKHLVRQIIKRLSTSFEKNQKRPDNIEGKIPMKNKNTKKLCSFLPQPKFFKNNLNSPKKKPISSALLLDTSIISKSPNFKIPLKKKIEEATPKSLHKTGISSKIQKSLTPKNFNFTPSSRSTIIVTPKIKNANSTPKRRQHESKIFLVNNRVHNSTQKNSPNETNSENDYDIPLVSPEVKKASKIVNRRIFSRNIAKKLDDTMYDEEDENKENLKQLNEDIRHSPVVKTKPTNLFKNIDTKTILGINKTIACSSLKNKAFGSKSDALPAAPNTLHMKQEKPCNREDIKIQKIGLNIPLLESPGSSHPTSASYLSVKNESDRQEELKIWDELDEIYKAKGQTPLASVSRLHNDSSTSLDTINSLPTAAADATLLSDIMNGSPFARDFERHDLSPKENNDESELRQSSDTESYSTPLRSTIGSTTNESFVSVDEEYAYIDSEKDVAFLERRLRFFPKTDDMNKAKCESSWADKFSELSIGSSRMSPRSSGGFNRAFNRGELAVSNTSLRHRLIALGDAPGPITDTTYNVYLKRLYKLKREDPVNLNHCILTSESQNEASRSLRIPKSFLDTDWMINLQPYRDLEEEAFREYENPNSKRKYRGGIAKSSFNYLLLDPRITRDLPRTGRTLALEERWRIFLEAIFYVGKGKAARPLAHLYDAFDHWIGKKRDDEPSEKIQKILEIWRQGKGVVCLQVFMNTMQEEAFTREAAMIDALGTAHLSNCNRGNYYGIVATMSNQEKRSLGKYFLYKAMEILMHDGERQQFPRNIE